MLGQGYDCPPITVVVPMRPYGSFAEFYQFADTHWMELIELWVAVSAAVMLGFYLGVMRDTSPASRRSMAELTGGRAALGFYLGTIGAGLVAPILVGMAGIMGGGPSLALAVTGAFSLAGDFFAKYAIAKADIYVPLMPAGRV